MTEDESKKINAILEKMKEMFGESLADPEVFPKIFQYQVNLAKYELQTSEVNK